MAETLKRGQTERDSGNVERVEGMGFGRYGTVVYEHCSRLLGTGFPT